MCALGYALYLILGNQINKLENAADLTVMRWRKIDLNLGQIKTFEIVSGITPIAEDKILIFGWGWD